MKCLKRIAPKKFLVIFPLEKGAILVGIFMSIVSIICVLVFLVEIYSYRQNEGCDQQILRLVYSFCLNTILCCGCMLIIHLWFVWGVVKEVPSVVLIWLAITGIWWLQGLSWLFIVFFVYAYYVTINIAWVIVLTLGVLAFVIFAYCILTGYGYWLTIRNEPQYSM